MSPAESIAGPQHEGNTPQPRFRKRGAQVGAYAGAERYSGDERLHKGTVNGDTRSFMRQIGWYRGVAMSSIPSLKELVYSLRDFFYFKKRKGNIKLLFLF